MRLSGNLCLGRALRGGGRDVCGMGGGSLAVGPGAQELDLGIFRGSGGPGVGETVPRVPSAGLWELVSLSQLVLCSKGVCPCRKLVGGGEGHNHVGSLWPCRGVPPLQRKLGEAV